MKHTQTQSRGPSTFPLPLAMLILGVLLVAASFLPLGNWAAQSQWTPADSAALDRVSNDYKRSSFQSPARQGLSQAEWQAQHEKMQEQIQNLQQQLDQAKSQPQRWSRTLMGLGILLAAAGFFAHSSQHS